MDFLQALERIMVDHKEIALASSVNNIPNVRLLNFYYDPQKKGIVYFSTFRDNPKVAEFSKNNQIAFTTVPMTNNEHVRVIGAMVQKSALTIYDLKEPFIKKNPGYETIIEQAGDQLDLYEVHFKEAKVILDFEKMGTVNL